VEIKLLNEELDTDNFLENIFFRNGIYDIKGFLNINKNALENPENYDNMEEGYQLLKDNLENKIGCLIDPDPDGFTSSSVTYLYIQKLNPMAYIKPFFHRGKQHGLTDKFLFDEILKSDINLLIIPDAGSNDFEQHKILKEKNIQCLVLDHHECEKYSEDAIVINNQLSIKVKNKQLSGAGVVYKFIQYCDKKNKTKYANEFLDLVALGNISDSMSTLSEETRFLCLEGLKNKNLSNGLFTELLDKYVKDEVNMMNVAWNLTPKINAIIRSGTVKDKVELFYAFVNPTEQIKFKKNSRTKEEMIDLSTKITAISEQLKKKQDAEVKEGMSLVEDKIDDTKKVIIIELDDDEISKAFTGLVANKYVNIYNKPVILLQKSSKNTYTGSVRCPELVYDIENFKDYIRDSELFIFCEGHPNAFGIEIKEENVEKFGEWIENKLKDKEISVGGIYEVEGEISADDLEETFISEVGSYSKLWGTNLEEPLFYITGVKINSNDIKMVFNKTILTFEYNYIQYQKRYCSRVFRERLGVDDYNNKEFELNIIAKLIAEKYNGNKYPKVDIVEIEILN
jgi:single-stranded-DNA-specific exonuclease